MVSKCAITFYINVTCQTLNIWNPSYGLKIRQYKLYGLGSFLLKYFWQRWDSLTIKFDFGIINGKLYRIMEMEERGLLWGLPGWLSGKESTCRCRRCKRCGLDPWSGRRNDLEKHMATHSSIVAWRIPWTEKPVWATVHRSQRVRRGLTAE